MFVVKTQVEINGMARAEPIMQIKDFVILDLFSNLSERIPPRTVDIKPQQDIIKAL